MLTLYDLVLRRTGRPLAHFLLILSLWAGLAMTAHAQVAPPNDDLTNAQAIVGTSGIVYGNNISATAESGEPPPDVNPAQASIWYYWTAPITTTMDFSTRGSTDPNGNELGTVMAIYTIPATANLMFSNLTLVASNEYDPSAGVTNGLVTSRIDLPVTIGQLYLIQIDGSTNTANGSNDQGYVELNWSPSLMGGTFTFSVNTNADSIFNSPSLVYFAGQYDDEITIPPVTLEPQSIDPSIHNPGGSNNVRITVSRTGGYNGRCEVTLLVTNSFYENSLATNYFGTNTYVTNYTTNGTFISSTNIYITNVTSEFQLEDLVDVVGYPQVSDLPVYGYFTVTQTNSSRPVTNVVSVSSLSIQTNFYQNFPLALAAPYNVTTVGAPVTNGSVVTITTTQVFATNASTNYATPSASNKLDYVAYSNVLVFNDFQMSQDVYLQINPKLVNLAGPDWPDTNGNYLYSGINPYLVLTLTNATLDPLEDPDIIPPTITTNGSNAYLGILTYNGNPFISEQGGHYLSTNVNQYVTINLERATFRVNKPATSITPPSSNIVYLYVNLTGNPGRGDTYNINYTIDCAAAEQLADVPLSDAFKWNDFPPVANSDYAQNSHYGVTDYDFGDPISSPANASGATGVGGGNTTWSGASGTISIGPNINNGNAPAGEIAIPIYNWGSTEFDVDMMVHLMLTTTAANNPNLTQSVPGFIGNIASANLTINYGGPEPGGAYDASFNPSGQSVTSSPPFDPTPGANPPPPDGGVVQAVAIQPSDGKAVIGGFFTSYNTVPIYSIARLLTNGWLDTNFNNVPNPGFNYGAYVRAIVIDANSNIIAGGDFSSYDGSLFPTVNIARLTPTGALDTSFNTGIGFNSTVYALAIDANSNIVVAGDFTSYNTTNCNHIVRLLPNGSLDQSFLPNTGNGRAGFGTDQDVRSLAIDGNQNIVLGGDFNYVNGTNMNFLARLLPSGALDPSFVPTTGPDDTVFSVAVETNNGNEIIIGGAFQNYSETGSPGLALITATGALDTTFPVGAGADGDVYTVGLQPDGKILVGGQFRNFNLTRRLGMARLLTNGWVDSAFMDTSYNQFAGLINTYYSEDTDPVHSAFAMAVQPDGNIIVGGSFTNVGGGSARNAIATQINVTRIIGASTPGPQTGGGGAGNCPGNITFTQDPYTVNDTSGKLYLTLDRVNGSLGPAQVTIGTNTLAPGPGSATANDFGLILPEATPLYNVVYNHWFENPAGTYGWKLSDGYFSYNILPSTGAPDALLPTTDLGDSTVNLNIFDDLSTDQNLTADLSLLNVTELNIVSSDAAPLMLGGVVVPTYPALGLPGSPLEIINTHFPVGNIGFSTTNYTVVNTSNSVTITVLRTNGSYGPISATYYTQNGTALSGSNYTGVTLSEDKTVLFTGGSNNMSDSFTIPILNKSTLQSTKSFTVYLTSASPSGVLDTNVPPVLPSVATVTIIDGNFAPGHLNFTSPTYSVLKGGAATVGVERIGGALGELTVQCATGNGTAASGSNYMGVTNTLTWTNQDVSVKTITVPTLQDNTVDGNLTFNVSLFNATNVGNPAQDGLILFPPTNAIVTIVESDSYGQLNFVAPNFNIMQTAGQAIITVARTGGTTGTDTVNYMTLNDTNPPPGYSTAYAGTNYGSTNGVLIFPPGAASETFVVPVYNTTLGETNVANRVVTLELFNGSANISNQFPEFATLTILDPGLVLSPAGAVDTTTQNGTGFNNYVASLALQPDGSLLAGGDFGYFNQYPFEYVARLLPGGNFDSTFLFDMAGANGDVLQVLSQVTNSAQTNDGAILIAGSFTSVDGVVRNSVARLNIDGSVDETFDPGNGADSTIYAAAETILPTGTSNQTYLAYYLGGNFANYNTVPSGAIVRVNASSNAPGYPGTLDPAFNVGQGVTGGDAAIHALAVDANNNVLAGGDFTSFNSEPYNHLVRISPTGAVDPTFNSGTTTNATDAITAMVIQPNGQIVIGGSFTNVTVSNVTYNLNHLARLNTDGSVDTNFNNNLGVGANDNVLALAVDSQERILVGGNFTRFDNTTRSGITRLNSDGSVDPSINFGTAADGGFVDTIVVQPNDEIDVGGGFTTFEGMNENNFVRLYGGANSGNGAIQFSQPVYGVLENGTNAVITLQRTGGLNGTNVSIVFSTSDDTAFAGTNYIAVSTNVTFPVGETFENVLVPVINNGAVGGNVVVNLNLSNPLNTEIAEAQPTAILIITNVNSQVEFSEPSYRDTADAPGGYAIIPVQRIGDPNSTVSVIVYTGNTGTAAPFVDYYPETNVITFYPGMMSNNFTVPLLNPNIFSDETVDLEMTSPSNTVIGSPSSATLTIASVLTNAGDVSFLLTNYTAEDDSTNAVITIIRTGGSSGPVSVTLTTSDGTGIAGSNYLSVDTQVNFSDGQTNQTVNIPLILQTIAGTDRTVYLTLSNPQGTAIMGVNPAVLTIKNDIENVNIANTPYTVSENAGLVSVSIVRDGYSSNTVSATLYTYSPPNAAESNGFAVPNVDYTPVSSNLVFGPGVTEEIVPIPIIQGTNANGPLTFQLILTNAQYVSGSGPTDIQLGVPSTSTVTIQGDVTGFEFAANTFYVGQNGSNVVITVNRINPFTGTASVQYSTSDGTATNGIDYVGITNSTLNFANGQASTNFTVSIINRNLVENSKAFNVTLSNAQITAVGNNPTNAYVLTPSTSAVVITDVLVGVSFTSPTYSVSQFASQALIPVILIGPTNNSVSVGYGVTNGSATDGINYLASGGTLNFVPGQNSNNISIQLLGSPISSNITVLLGLTNATNALVVGPSNAVLTILKFNAINNFTVNAFASSAFLSWNTPVNSTAQVAYGLTTNYGNITSVSGPSTNHVVLLSGLTRNATYYFNAMTTEDGTVYSTNGSFNTVDTLILTTINANYTGSWQEGSASISNYYGSYYNITPTISSGNPSATASYVPNIPTPGRYNVSTWNPTNSAFSAAAPILITGATNSVVEYVDQAVQGGTWIPLVSNMYLSFGTGNTNTIFNSTGETGKYVVANAMMWSYASNQDYTAGSVPAWWSYYWSNYFGTNTAALYPIASNYTAYVLGTSSGNPADTLNFWVSFPTTNSIMAWFAPYQGGRTYQLQSTTNLSNPNWVTLTNVLPVLATNAVTNNGSVFTGYGAFTTTFTNTTFFRLSVGLSTNY